MTTGGKRKVEEGWRGPREQGQGGHSQVVLRLDDQAPPRPDEASSSQGEVLGDGKLLDGAGEV